MGVYNFKLIYGEYSGIEKKAIDIVSSELSGYFNYVFLTLKAEEMKENDLKSSNLIIIGTEKSNSIIKKLMEQGFYKCADREEGYSIKVTENIFDSNAQMAVISGFDEKGLLYGIVDFLAYYIPSAENTHDHGHYFRDIFGNEKLAEYEKISAPSIKQRGIWTWGHVIYDYKKYIENMVHLKMNTLIIWNDYVPINICEVIEEAHSCGIKIYLGFSWGWNEARKENGGLDISDEQALDKIQKIIVEKYDESYSNLEIDGIYFQSFTETKESRNNDIVIAERVVELVNHTAEELYKRNPDLMLMFGLHATSVIQELEYIKKTDKRIMIVWEDCGAFPYAYTPQNIKDFEDTCTLSNQIAVLRGKDDNFGIVSKGLTCLDWRTFKHIKGKFVLGKCSESFIRKRAAEKEKLWKYVNAYWIKNADYAYDTVKLLKKANENTLVTALIEDGMLEEQIYFAAALYAEMLWNTETTADELMLKVSLRKDVEC